MSCSLTLSRSQIELSERNLLGEVLYHHFNFILNCVNCSNECFLCNVLQQKHALSDPRIRGNGNQNMKICEDSSATKHGRMLDTKKKEKNNHNYSLLGEYFCSMLCLILEMEIKICGD